MAYDKTISPTKAAELHKGTQVRYAWSEVQLHSSLPFLSYRTDQLLADIDDMLADLSTHLDFMIPGSS